MESHLAFLLVVVLGHSLPNTCQSTDSAMRRTNISRSDQYGIVGGSPAKISKFPYTVSVSFNGSLLGAGAIVNKHWIVCSACQLEGYEQATLTIRAGSDYSATGGQAFNTTKIFINVNYAGDFPYNIAVIKLNSAIEFNAKAKPVKITSSPPRSSCKGVITGWGKQEAKANTLGGNKLQMARITVRTEGECHASHPTVDISKVICADADGVGPCYGDQGDPLVCGKKLLGHFIGGNVCNLLPDIELYSNIAAYRKWVIQTIKEHSVGDESDGVEDE